MKMCDCRALVARFCFPLVVVLQQSAGRSPCVTAGS